MILFDTNKVYVYRGQKVYFDMMFSIFSKYIRKHLVITGTIGMGREALIYGIAERIKKGNCPEEFKDYSVIELDLRTFFIGIAEEGDVQRRLDQLTEKLKQWKKVILYIKPFEKVFELSMLGELGKWMEIPELIITGILSEDDFSGLYKPSMTHPVIEKIDVLRMEYPTLDETYNILKTKIAMFSEHYGIEIHEEEFEKLLMTVYQDAGGVVNLDMVLDYVDSALANAKLHRISVLDFRSIMEIQKASIVEMQEDFTEEQLKETSMHEAAHAVVAITLENTPRFVTIIPEYENLGYNYFDKVELVYTRPQLINQIAITVASCVLPNVTDMPYTNGCAADLRSATMYAYNMILCWGMSEEAGKDGFEKYISYLKEGQFEISFLSDKAKDDVKEQATKIVDEGSKLAEKCLKEHLEVVHEISKALLRCCSLSRTDLLKLYRGEIKAENLQEVKWREID